MSRHAKAKLIFAILMIAVLVLTACSQRQQPAQKPEQQPQGQPAAQEKVTTVKIGVNGPLSGQYSKIGMDALQAVQMAVDEFNTSKRVPGLKIEVVTADDAADPAKATAAIERLVADQAVVGLVGPMMSHIVEAVMPILDKAGVVAISQSATNPALSTRGWKTFHRICPRDDDQGPAAANFIIKDLGAKTIYVIDDKTTFGQGLADQVEATLKKLGATKTWRDHISTDDKDFSAILTRVKQANPDLLYLAISSPAQGANIAKQMSELGIPAKLMGSEVFYERDEFVLGAGGKAEGAYLTSIGPILDSVPEAQEFIKKYDAKYGARSAYTGQSYDAANIIIQAIEKAYANDQKVERQEVLQNVHNTDYKGVMGIRIRFTDKGDLRGGTLFIFQVKGDNFVQLKTVSATVE